MKANIYLVFMKYVKAIAFSIILLISSFTVFAAEDLKISVFGPSEVNPGDEITYLVTFYNAGTTPAENVKINFSLSGGACHIVYGDNLTISGSTTKTISWDESSVDYLGSLGAGVHTLVVKAIAGEQSLLTSGSSGYYTSTHADESINVTYSIESTDTGATPVVLNNTPKVVELHDVSLGSDMQGAVKSSTGTIMIYQFQVYNNGNVYDQFLLSQIEEQCNIPGADFKAGLLSDATFLDINGNPLTGNKTQWIEPGVSQLVLLKLVLGNGAPATTGYWGCNNVTAKSVIDNSVLDNQIFSTNIVPKPDGPLLNLSVLDDKDPVESGDILTYTIFAYNSNDAKSGLASNFKITNILDANVEFIQASITPVVNGNELSWSFATLDYGIANSKTITVEVRVKDISSCDGTLDDKAFATYTYVSSGKDVPARYPSVDFVHALTTVQNKPDLAITKSSISTAVFGQEVTYTLNYQNNGTCTAGTVSITDHLPTTYTDLVAGSVTDNGVFNAPNGELSWNIGSVAPGASGEVSYKLKVKDESYFNPGTTPIINTADIELYGTDANYQDNFSTNIVYVFKLPDLSVTKSIIGDPDYLAPNTTYTYEISVNNNGYVGQDNVTLLDYLPTGLSYVSSTDGGSESAGTVTWNLGTLAAGASRTVQVEATVGDCTLVGSTLTNSASVSGYYNDADESDNTDELTKNVEDNQDPVLTAEGNQDVNLDGGCSITVPNLVDGSSATDNCTYTITQSPLAGTVVPASHNGTVDVVVTATDAAGNTDEATVVLTAKDVTAPVLTAEGNQDVNLDGGCSITIPNLVDGSSATDNCTYTITQSPLAGTVVPASHNGTVDVVVTATDAAGNTDEATVVLTAKDVTAPVLTAEGNQDVNLDGGCSITIPNLVDVSSATDNCTYTITQSPLAGTVVPASHNGTVDVVVTATDAAGNTDEATVVLTAKDVTAPVLTAEGNQDVNLDGGCSITIPNLVDGSSATDNCTYTITQSPLAGTVVPASHNGTVDVVVTATDAAGNTDEATVVLTAKDVTAPVLTAEGNQDVNLDSGCSITIPNLVDGSSAIDNCTHTITQSPLAGTVVPASHNGTVDVVVTATDAAGNTDEATVVLTAKDVTAPVLTAEGNQDVNLDGGCSITIPNLVDGSSATDNCTYTITQSPLAGTVVPASHNDTVDVVVTATDAAGNTDEATVVLTAKDVTAPVLTAEGNQDVNLDGGCSITIPNLVDGSSAIDNCTHTITQSPLAGTVVPASHNGTVDVVVTATDAAGNTDEATVVLTAKDVTAPVLTAEGNQDVNLDSGCSITIPNLVDGSSAIDNCTHTITQSPLAGTVVPASHNGTVDVVVTATDAAGNTDEATVVLTAKDVTAPVLTAEGNQDVNLDGGCSITVPNLVDGSSAIDNCTHTITQSPLAGTVVPASHNGTVDVVVTATDAAGNTDEATVVLTAKDVTAPVLTAEGNQDVNLDGGCSITIPNLVDGSSATDNCTYTITQSPLAGTVVPASHNGTVDVVVTATDAAGNTDEATVVLTAKDVTAPVLTAEGNQDVNLDGGCSITVPNLVDGSSAIDNCTHTITQSPLAGTVVPASHNGTVDVVVTATDAAGNSDSETVTLTVVDDILPTVSAAADLVTTTSADANGDCTVDIPITDAVFADNCLSDLTWTMTGTVSDNGSGQVGTYTFPIGTTTITYTNTDAAGSTATDAMIVTVTDDEDPSITCAPNQVQTTDEGEAEANVTVVSPSASDNCSVQSILNDRTGTADASGVYPLGTTTVTWIVTDGSGNTSTCQQTITVTDDEPPTIECAVASQTQTADPGVCQADVTVVTPNANDNNMVVSLLNDYNNTSDASDTYPVGTTTVVWTVTDDTGNTSICSQDVIVTDDEVPSITCAEDQTQTADAGVAEAAVTVTAPGTSDNCGVAGVVNDYNNTADASGTYPVGTTPVTWTVTDIHGNTSTCVQNITVTDDEDPTISCSVSSQTQTADAGVCSAAVTVMAPTVNDNTAVASVINDYNGTADASDTYPVGTTTVTWTVTDIHGNTNQCSQDVTVTDDEAPSITCAGDQTQTADAGVPNAAVVVSAPATGDNCGVAAVVNDYNNTADASGTYPVGTTPVTWTVTDIHGNTSTCVQNITVTDDEDPTISCSVSSQTQTADAGVCSAAVTVVAPTVNDNTAVASVINDYNGTADASDTYPVGTTTVTWTVTDDHGNTNQCSQDVTVTDDEAPSITCAGDQTQTADAGVPNAAVVVSAPATGDNCGVAAVVNDFNNTADASGTYPVGTTPVTWTVTDIHGNTSTCVQNITVTDDEDPTISCSVSSQTQTADAGVCSAAVTVMAPTVNDNTAVASVINDYNGTADASDTYPVGTTTVTWTVTDIHGNTNQCSQDVTVTDDEAPSITCAGDQTQTADAGVPNAAVVVSAPATGDNCGVAAVVNDYNNTADASGTYPVGTTPVTWTVTDIHGNTSTCVQNITVTDDEDPTISCSVSSQTQTADAGVCSAAVTVVAPTVNDNTAVASVINDYNGTADASDTYPVGTTTVTWTVTDDHGNTNQCSQDVTVTDDEAPSITCAGDQTQTADAGVPNAAVVVSAPATGDNCGVAAVVNDFNNTADASGTYPVGTTPVTWTVTDIHGNTSTCVQNITVTDDENPTINCSVSSQTQTADVDVCQAAVTVVAPTVNDNTVVVSLINDYNGTSDASDIYLVGTTVVTWTVTDENGNTNQCSQSITVTDDQLPAITCGGDISETIISSADCDHMITVPTPNSSDNCAVESVVNDFNGLDDASAVYPFGTTTVVWTATDVNGNQSTCTQTITLKSEPVAADDGRGN